MLAYQLVEWQQPPELREVDVPEPGPREVLIKVGGAGACHSDLHVMEWPAGEPRARINDGSPGEYQRRKLARSA